MRRREAARNDEAVLNMMETPLKSREASHDYDSCQMSAPPSGVRRRAKRTRRKVVSGLLGAGGTSGAKDEAGAWRRASGRPPDGEAQPHTRALDRPRRPLTSRCQTTV